MGKIWAIRQQKRRRVEEMVDEEEENLCTIFICSCGEL